MNLLPPPGPARTRQLVALVVLLGLLGYFGWDYIKPAPTAVVPVASKTAATEATGPLAASAMPQPIDTAALSPVAELAGSSRNPFRFGVPPPPPRPPMPPPPVYTPPVYTPPPPPPAPTIPPIPLKFTTLMIGPDGRKIAGLVDGRNGVFTGSEGDVIDGRYRIVKIGVTSLVIEYLDGTGRRTLGLGT